MKNITFILAIPLLFLLTADLFAKKDKYDDWLKKEVDLLITKDEKAEFKKLKNDKDKEFFIKLFWAKRDPSPRTEKNEFKEEYYKRLAYLHDEKPFRYKYKTGLETDQGKVYLFFGKAKIFPQGDYEVWLYQKPGWLKDYPKETISFIFKQVAEGSAMAAGGNISDREGSSRNRIDAKTLDQVGYVFDREQTDTRVMRAYYDFPKNVIFYPDLKELPEYEEILAFAPDSFEGGLISLMNTSGDNIIQVPFDQEAFFVKADNLSSHATFLMKIDPAGNDIKPGKVAAFGRLRSENYTNDFRTVLELQKEKDYYIARFAMPLFPGEYDFYLGICSADKKLYSLKKQKLLVPDLWKKELAVSSLLGSPQVEEFSGESRRGDSARKRRDVRDSLKDTPWGPEFDERSMKDEFDVFQVGKYKLTPYFCQEYSADQFLNVFYYIYNVKVDETGKCRVTVQFELENAERKFKMRPQFKQQELKEGEAILDGTRVPLANLPSGGEYVLNVRVMDEVAVASAKQTLKFTLNK